VWILRAFFKLQAASCPLLAAGFSSPRFFRPVELESRHFSSQVWKNVALIVQKYGGTSVGSPDRIKNVARRVAKFKALGNQVVVVVSAMSGETNRLIGLAHEIQKHPDPRELDVIISTGEQVTIGLLAMALKELGLKAKSYTGGQVKILTDSAFTKARIVSIDEQNIRTDLANDYVVVVAGFQGVDEHNNITTLGRGGSDTTGVAVAAALRADECSDLYRCGWRLHH